MKTKGEIFIENQRETGACKKCYQDQRGAIQMCEIEGICKYDKRAVRYIERLLRNA